MVRRLAASLLVVLVLCLISHASLWQSSVKQPGTPDSQKENPAAVHDNQRSWEDGGSEEVSALRYGSDALAAYDKKPDCFKKAAQALRQGCKSIDLDEDEKTKSCEIATANMPMPVECMDFGEARDSSSSYTNSKSHEIGRCVQSLGRVPQLWTSYSGYFREVKVMCLAVQYSLENDELRNLQRNLTRNHADQIALLRAQRQELLETHRVETAQLKEIQDLHSKMGAQVNAILTSASQMRGTLASILKDISIITQHTNQGVTEQELALDNMRQIKEELLSGFQVTLLQTVELVTRQSQSWHEMMSNGLLRFQELDRHAEEQLVKILRANQGLESMIQQVGEVTNQLQDLKEQAVLGTQELLEQQDKGSEEFTQLTTKILHNMILALDTLDNHTQTSWQGMIETFKAESSDFQKEVADLLASTASDIGAMASESQEKLDQLNDAFYELKAKRWRFFWPIQMAIQFLGAEGSKYATGPNFDLGIVPPPGDRKIDAAYVHKSPILEVDAVSRLSQEKQEPNEIHLHPSFN
ncbi:hypothetical protein BGZ74_007706 [Mortierella antarctica]|nr:hypothetical protein BGZ74_007706 [Mortierella antarctica]